ncbi:hypothetical protein [Priestia megaterium]|uniref:hypothetical protein n=1 Tax=Priestia megaterium TaxID=1404 RepID=UPI00186911F5|nr:hypothetical protein [Priestia megaterium]MBE2973419.1 hypothetical protein [Priestia megaterium]
MIESYKFWAQYYVICRLNDIENVKEFEANPFLYRNKSFSVSILGYCNNSWIVDQDTGSPRFEFLAGDYLYSSKVTNILNQSIDRSLGISNIGKVEFQKQLDHAKSQISIEERHIGPELKSECNYGYPVKWLDRNWFKFEKLLRDYSSPK